MAEAWEGKVCEARIYDRGGSYRCGKPAKGIGQGGWASPQQIPMCGAHLAGEHRRRENGEKRDAEAVARNRDFARKEAIAARLKEWGVYFSPSFGQNIVITEEGAKRLANHLGSLKENTNG